MPILIKGRGVRRLQRKKQNFIQGAFILMLASLLVKVIGAFFQIPLLNMIGGMDIPDEGEVIVDGVNLRGLKEKELAVFRRSKVGFVYQSFNLVPTLTVKENILFPLSLAGSTPDPVFFDEIVELLHLKERLNAYPGELSGGGQQRVAIARALIAKPAILLADEPTGNLDSRTGQNVLGLLKLSVETYRQTLVMITHNLELAQMADRVVRIEDGRIRV